MTDEKEIAAVNAALDAPPLVPVLLELSLTLVFE